MQNTFQKEDFSASTTTTPTASTESMLMSFLGGLLPFMSSEAEQKTGVDEDREEQDVRMFKRLGLAAPVGGDESKR